MQHHRGRYMQAIIWQPEGWTTVEAGDPTKVPFHEGVLSRQSWMLGEFGWNEIATEDWKKSSNAEAFVFADEEGNEWGRIELFTKDGVPNGHIDVMLNPTEQGYWAYRTFLDDSGIGGYWPANSGISTTSNSGRFFLRAQDGVWQVGLRHPNDKDEVLQTFDDREEAEQFFRGLDDPRTIEPKPPVVIEAE